MPETNGRTQENTRNAKGQFLPGVSGGPGRTKGTPNFREELLKSMRGVEKVKRQSAFARAWEMAWDDPSMMAALMRKLLPDLAHQTGSPPSAIHVHYGHTASGQPCATIVQHTPEPLPVTNGHGD